MISEKAHKTCHACGEKTLNGMKMDKSEKRILLSAFAICLLGGVVFTAFPQMFRAMYELEADVQLHWFEPFLIGFCLPAFVMLALAIFGAAIGCMLMWNENPATNDIFRRKSSDSEHPRTK